MLDWTRAKCWRFGASRAMGIGACAGGVEAVGQSIWLKDSLGLMEFGALALGCVAAMTLVGGVLGLCTGLIHLIRPRLAAPRAVAVQLSLVAAIVCGLYVFPAGRLLWSEGRLGAAAAMAGMPLALYFSVFFNAHYFLRRFDLGAIPPVNFLLACAGTSLLLASFSVAVSSQRYTGGVGALEGDPNVLIVSIPGLRRDRIRTTWGGAPRPTPGWDALASQGVTFANAVTPSPVTRAAHATTLTGLHPLRHRVLGASDTLYRGYQTLQEVLDEEGYATAAFTGTEAARGESAIGQGFRVHDDGAPRWSRLLLARYLGWNWTVAPSGSRVDSWVAWLEQHEQQPWMAWIELADLDAWERTDGLSTEAYNDAVGQVDSALGRVNGLLRERGLMERTLVIVHGSHGQMLGEHERVGRRGGLWEELVRVPLVVVHPGSDAVTDRVESQVRLMDVAPTVTGFLGVKGFDQTEGVSLLDYAQGRRSRGMWCALTGEEGGLLLGMRANGVKYVRRLADDRKWLFNVEQDPGERAELSGSNPQTLADAERMLAGDLAAARKLAGP